MRLNTNSTKFESCVHEKHLINCHERAALTSQLKLGTQKTRCGAQMIPRIPSTSRISRHIDLVFESAKRTRQTIVDKSWANYKMRVRIDAQSAKVCVVPYVLFSTVDMNEKKKNVNTFEELEKTTTFTYVWVSFCAYGENMFNVLANYIEMLLLMLLRSAELGGRDPWNLKSVRMALPWVRPNWLW